MDFDNLFGRSLMGVFVIRNGKILYCNQHISAIFGYSRQELSDSEKILENIFNENFTRFKDQVNSVLSEQVDAVHTEFRCVTKNGDKVWGEICISLVDYQESRAILCLFHDITASRKLATLIVHEKYLSDTIINGLPGIFYVADKNDQLLRWNKNLENLTGCTGEELYQKHTTDFVAASDLELVRRKKYNAFKTGKESGEVKIITKQKQTVIYFLTIQPITYNDQECVLCIGVDLTDKKKAEQELVKKNWEINERVKELRLLYKISRLVKHNHYSLEWLLEQCVQFIPAAYQYPEITCARIKFGDKEFSSRGFMETVWKQESPLYLKGEEAGKITVCYTEQRPAMSEGPFLAEERALITTISEIVANAIETTIADKEVLKLSRLYQFTSAINEMTLRTKNRSDLFSEACRIAVRKGRFRMAWMGVYNALDNTVTPIAYAGYDGGYLKNITISLNDDLAPGPIKKSFSTRTYYYCNDIANDPIFLPWREHALEKGFRSSIYLPVVVNNQVECFYILYMPEPFFFNESEIKMLKDVTDNIAFAMDKLRLEELQIQAEEELRESEEKFRKLVEETLAGVFIIQDNRFIYTNPQLENILGYNREQLTREISFEKLIHKDDLGRFKESLAQNEKNKNTSENHQFRAIRSDGALLYLEIIASPINFQGKGAIIGTIVDNTKQAEEQNRISLAVTEAQEEERLQISMELHDNVKQIMTASLLNVDFIRMNLNNEKMVNEIITKVKGFITEAINELRRISHQLTPGIDSTLSLEDRIVTLVEIMNIYNKLAVSYKFKGIEGDIDHKIQLVLYRILQEQLSNVLKHANATSLMITIQHKGHQIMMSVKDNGKGFDPAEKKQGIGLENIKRRVELQNGSMYINTAPGKGCDLVVQIPI